MADKETAPLLAPTPVVSTTARTASPPLAAEPAVSPDAAFPSVASAQPDYASAYPATAVYNGQPAYGTQGAVYQSQAPPPAYVPNMTTVTVNMPLTPLLPDVPAMVVCPNCRNSVFTVVAKENGALPWLACVGLSLCGCFLGCCLIPFCIDSMKDTVHTCPNCNALIGVRRRM